MSKKIPFSAVLLAGGDSKRMGTNKAFLTLEGKRLVDIVFEKVNSLFYEVIIVTDRPDDFKYLPAKFTRDLFVEGDKNALRGIHAGLTASSNTSCFVTGCDMPFLSLPLVKYMSQYADNYDAVVPRHEGFYQPLFAFYNKTSLDLISRRLKEKYYKIVDLFPSLNTKEIDEEKVRSFDPNLLSFSNINTKDDYLNIMKLTE